MRDYSGLSDHDILLLVAQNVESLHKTVESLDEARMLELTQCPFHPARQQNGNSVVKRVADVESQILRAKWFAAGLGIVNIGAISKDYLGKLAQQLLGG